MGDLLGGEADGSVDDEPSADEISAPLRRNPWNLALVVVGVVALVAAASLTVWSRSVSADATSAKHEAADLDAQRQDLADQQLAANRGRADLNGAAAGVASAFSAYEDALTDLADAQRRLVDVQNQAVDRADHGNQAAAADLLRTEGDPLLAEVTAKVAVVDRAMTTLEAKDADLQAATHG